MAGSRSLGALTLDLVVKTGGFKQGFDAAAREAAAAGGKIAGAMESTGQRIAASLATPLEKARASIKLYNDLLAATAITQQTYDRAIKETATAYTAGTAAAERWNKMVAEGKRLTEAAISPLERYRQRFKEITQLALSGNLTPQARQFAIDEARAERNAADPETQRKNALLRERDAIIAKNATEYERLNAQLARAHQLEKEGVLVGKDYNREVDQLNAAIKALDPAVQEQNRELANTKALLATLVDPLDAYNRKLQIYQQQLNDTKITQDEFNKLQALAFRDTPQGQLDARQTQRATEIKGEGVTALQARKTAIKEINDLLAAGKLTQDEANAAIKRAEAVYKSTSAAGRAYANIQREYRALAESVQTPLEQLNAKLKRYEAIIKVTNGSQVVHNRLIAQAKAEYQAQVAPIERSAGALSRFGSFLKRSAVGLAGAYVGFNGIRRLAQVADEYKRLENRISLTTSSTEELNRVQDELFQVAQRTRQEYAGVADLYAKLALTGKDLGVSQKDIIKFTEGVGNALAISGTSAQTARGALNQLAQGLAAGTFRAEEFNSILEGAPEIIRVVARNIDRFKGNVGLLRKEVADSKFTSQEFFTAFQKGTDDLKNKIASLDLTPGQALTQLKNAFNQAVADADLSPLVESLQELSALILDPNFQEGLTAFVNAIITLASLGAKAAAGIGGIFKSAAENVRFYTGRMSPIEAFDIAIQRAEKDLEKLQERANRGLNYGVFGSGSEKEFQIILNRIKQLKAGRDELLKRKGSLLPDLSKLVPEVEEEEIKPIAVVDPKLQKEIDAARESILNQIAALEQQRAVMGLNAVETIKYRITQGDLADEFAKAGPAFNKYKDALIQGTAALEQATAQENLNKIVEGVEAQIDAFEREKIAQEQGAAAAARWDAEHGELAETIRASAGIFKAANGAAVEYGTALEDLSKPVDIPVDIDDSGARAAISRIVDGIETITVTASRGIGDNISDGIEDQEQAFLDAAKAVDAYAKTLDELSLKDLKTKYLDPAGFPIDVTRPITENLETEFTITVEIDDRFYNIPTVIDGVLLDAEKDLNKIVDDAMRRLAEGESLPNFATKAEALAQAPLRSAAIEQARLQAAADIEAARGVNTLTEATRRYNEALAILKDINSTVQQKQDAYAIIQQTKATLDAAKSVREMVKSLQEQRVARETLRIEEELGVAAAIDYRIAHGDLKEVFRELGNSGAAFRDQLIEISEAEKKLAKENEAIEASEQLIGDADKAAEEWAKQIEGLTIRLGRGKITQEQFNKAVREADRAFKEATGAIDEFTIYMEEAARNTQDILADFFANPFEGDLTDFVNKFDEAFRKIAANAIAAKVADKLFNDVDGVLTKMGEKVRGLFGDSLPEWLGGPKDAALEDIAVTAQKIPETASAALTPALTTFAPAATALTPAMSALSSTLAAATAPMAALPPALSAFVPTATALTPAMTTFVPAATALAPALTAFVPAATALTSALGSASSGGLESIPLSDLLPLAGGGPVVGPGTGTSDSILARLSAGEYVIPAAIVQKPGMLDFLEKLRLFGDLPKFAGGGFMSILAGDQPDIKLGGIWGAFKNLLPMLMMLIGKGGSGLGMLLGGLLGRASGGPLDVRSGGMLHGPGTPTSDDMLLWGSTNEFMVRAKAVQQPGARRFLDAFNSGQISMDEIHAMMKLMAPRMATGGLLDPRVSYASSNVAQYSGFNAESMSWKPAGPSVIQQSIHINSPNGQVSRATEMQVAAAAARGVRNADRHNN